MTRSKALKTLGSSSMAKEYVEEAEHQDGKKYWKKFKGAKGLKKDYNLYKSIAGGG